MKCYLIGLNHGYQLRGCKTHDWEAFDKYLSSFCKTADIDLIAEELSEWAILRNSNLGATGSVAKDVAPRLGITHLFCDPDEEERLRIRSDVKGWISKQEEWSIRECYWLDKLREMNFKHCVFILGAKHVGSFKELLASDGIEVEVEKEDWEP